MNTLKAAITGVHGGLPEYVLTNQKLEQMVDTSDEWITTRTGIKERRILNNGQAASDLGADVVKGLLEKTGTAPEEVDFLICGTITGDRIFPDTANTILDKIGAANAYGFDLNAACSGFLYALVTAAKFVETGTHKKVIVVGMDIMSSIIDYTDRTTCVIFGDGCGAVLLEPSEGDYGIEDAILKSDGSGRHFLYMKAGGSMMPPSMETVANRDHYVIQDGRAVYKRAVSGMAEVVEEIIERNGLTNEDIDWLVPHQANVRIINAVAQMLGYPLEKVMINIQKYGNTTAATLPLCLWEWEDQLKPGDKIILTAFGGGYTWGSCLISWAY